MARMRADLVRAKLALEAAAAAATAGADHPAGAGPA